MAFFRMTEHKPKRLAPMPVRLTHEQFVLLDRLRGHNSRNAYVILKIFDCPVPPSNSVRSPVKDREALGQALGLLGRSELTANAKVLADAARTGSLPATPETAEKIDAIERYLAHILRLLLKALDVRSGL